MDLGPKKYTSRIDIPCPTPEKRVSVQNKDGSVAWQMREGTTLSCPAVNPGHGTGSRDNLSDVEAGAANKRARVYSENWTGESEPGTNNDVKK